MDKPTKRRGQGFGALPPEERARISSLGGKTAHLNGTAHKFTQKEAREAGSKGGRAARAKRQAGA